MTKDETANTEGAELRRRAEEALRARAARPGGVPTEAEALRMIHELEVHQIELELQFDALHEANERLAAERTRYRELYDFAPAGYVTLDRAGTISEMNVTAASLLGADVEQLVGKRLGMFVADGDRGQLHEMLREILDADAPRSCDLELRRSDGDRSVRLEGLPGPNPGECRASFWDTTQIRQAERALRLHDRAMRSVSQGILISDPRRPNNPIVYANPSLERTTGYATDELDGKSWHVLVGAETSQEAIREIDRAFEAAHTCSVELLCYRKDGSTYWGALHVTPMHDEAERVTEFVVVQIDVSERREHEEALAHSQRMEALGRLSGGIAHDFNNLLTIVGNSVELARSGLDDSPASDDLREHLEAIGEAGTRGAQLTGQLLGFSRRHVAPAAVIAVNEHVTNTTLLLRRLLPADTELQVSLDETTSYVKMDPGQLEQVLINLVVNARDAMPLGGTIGVDTRAIELTWADCKPGTEVAPGPFVRIRVTDEGTGMDAATLARVFEPFFTTKTPGRGTGLGLSTSFWVVKRSGGLVQVESELGRGSTFVVLLPRTDERPPKPAPPRPVSEAPATQTILLAEDEPLVRTLVARTLTNLGYAVLAVGDGIAALEQLERHPGVVDALVTDVVMPKMGGRELAERVRALRPDMCVLFMSGYTDDPTLVDGIPGGVVGFLQKPFSSEGLRGALERLLAPMASPIA